MANTRNQTPAASHLLLGKVAGVVTSGAGRRRSLATVATHHDQIRDHILSNQFRVLEYRNPNNTRITDQRKLPATLSHNQDNHDIANHLRVNIIRKQLVNAKCSTLENSVRFQKCWQSMLVFDTRMPLTANERHLAEVGFSRRPVPPVRFSHMR